MSADFPLFVIPVALLFIALSWAAIYLIFRSKRSVDPGTQTVLSDGGRNIPLIAAFAGWKGIPWIGWASSNIGPRLVLHRDHLEFKVIRTRTRPYTDVSNVDYRRAIWTENVVIEFADSIASFAGNAANRSVAQDAVRFLFEKGCPLSERAKELISQG